MGYPEWYQAKYQSQLQEPDEAQETCLYCKRPVERCACDQAYEEWAGK